MSSSCPNCGASGGYPPYTCGECGAVVKPCPCCHGRGAVIEFIRRGDKHG